MYQSLSYIIITVSLMAQFVFSATLILNLQEQLAIESDLGEELNFKINEGKFNFVNASYTQDQSNKKFHMINVTLIHDGASQIENVSIFDVFSSFADESDSQTYLLDYRMPYQNTTIISEGTYWNYSISADTIFPGIWNPGEYMCLYLWITTQSAKKLTGIYSIGIFTEYGWGIHEVISI